MEWQAYYIIATSIFAVLESWYWAGHGYFASTSRRLLITIALAPVTLVALATAGEPGVPWQHIVLIGVTCFGLASSLTYLVYNNRDTEWGVGPATAVTLINAAELWLFFSGLS